MQYFNESDDNYERIGKVIGDAFSALLVLAVIAIYAYSLLGRLFH